MKLSILLSILFELLTKRQVSAGYLAEKHGVSPRTIYRYVEILATAVPVEVKRGRNGGVRISDSYKLPVGFMSEWEYDAAIEALTEQYSRTLEERFLLAMRKLSAQEKTETRETTLTADVGDIVVCGGKSSKETSEKLLIIQESLEEKTVLETEYAVGEVKTKRKIEPHSLVFADGKWYVYGFCHTERAFLPFALDNLLSLFKTKQTFRKRPFKKADIFNAIHEE